MDNLKSAIADKVLDISSLSGDDMKVKLEKINRFRDFVDACRSLILKYPAIEAELLRMVENNDFDTRIASSRVDTIIRLSEKEGTVSQSSEQRVEDDIHNLEEIVENIENVDVKKENSKEIEEINTATEDLVSTSNQVTEQSPKETIEKQKQIAGEDKDPVRYLPEDVDYEEIDEEKQQQYVDYEEIIEGSEKESQLAIEEPDSPKLLPQSDEKESIPEQNNEVSRSVVEANIQTQRSSIIEEKDNRGKDTAKKVLQVCAIVAVVVALIFIIRFVINNWQAILYGLGAAVVVGGIVWFLLKKKKSAE
ncbi:hypothetical protein [Dysgonomonas macrotermitis]|uniref:Uncharacterized protein n=1 Tax=Dysgonomonas macrotermitis TaxID=1346286 RepID=A0A1M5E2C9_9BACT|nr:hypothetical protein [Dysgonomonas macrotermitis]SHF73294.1 hypothetical protein SAMN05444362_109126 [Dysgonomonas macrotermitis]